MWNLHCYGKIANIFLFLELVKNIIVTIAQGGNCNKSGNKTPVRC